MKKAVKVQKGRLETDGYEYSLYKYGSKWGADARVKGETQWYTRWVVGQMTKKAVLAHIEAFDGPVVS